MLNVMQDVQAKQFELQDQEGRSCRFRINPYRTMDNRIDGVVLSVLDIDEAANRKPDGNKRSQSKNKK